MERFPDHSAQPSEERVTYVNHRRTGASLRQPMSASGPILLKSAPGQAWRSGDRLAGLHCGIGISPLLHPFYGTHRDIAGGLPWSRLIDAPTRRAFNPHPRLRRQAVRHDRFMVVRQSYRPKLKLRCITLACDGVCVAATGRASRPGHQSTDSQPDASRLGMVLRKPTARACWRLEAAVCDRNLDRYYSMLIGRPISGRLSSVCQAAGSGVDSGPVT
jgi:hypothetical protein